MGKKINLFLNLILTFLLTIYGSKKYALIQLEDIEEQPEYRLVTERFIKIPHFFSRLKAFHKKIFKKNSYAPISSKPLQYSDINGSCTEINETTDSKEILFYTKEEIQKKIFKSMKFLKRSQEIWQELTCLDKVYEKELKEYRENGGKLKVPQKDIQKRLKLEKEIKKEMKKVLEESAFLKGSFVLNFIEIPKKIDADGEEIDIDIYVNLLEGNINLKSNDGDVDLKIEYAKGKLEKKNNAKKWFILSGAMGLASIGIASISYLFFVDSNKEKRKKTSSITTQNSAIKYYL